MPETTYNYSVSDDFPNGSVNVDRLDSDIDSSIAVSLLYINVTADDCAITFVDALSSGQETTLDAIVAAHSGQALATQNIDAKGNPVVATSIYGYSAERTRFMGYRYSAPPNTLSIFDEVIVKQLFLQGGDGSVDYAVDGDYAEFSIIDKDDVLGFFVPLGLTVGVDILEIDKYIKKKYMADGHNEMTHRVPVAAPVLEGLYFRLTYNAVAGGTNRIIRPTYLWYENPN
jgi:hypothetical protein